MDENYVSISMDELYDLIRSQVKLNMVRELLFNNVRLNYNDKLLTVDSDEAFTQMLEVLSPVDAEDKIDELKAKKEAEQ